MFVEFDADGRFVVTCSKVEKVAFCKLGKTMPGRSHAQKASGAIKAILSEAIADELIGDDHGKR